LSTFACSALPRPGSFRGLSLSLRGRAILLRPTDHAFGAGARRRGMWVPRLSRLLPKGPLIYHAYGAIHTSGATIKIFERWDIEIWGLSYF
jgi:hypothetical protein